MTITTKEEAFKILDTQKWGIPFEAIEFLYNHPKDEEILAKICHAIYFVEADDAYYDEEEDFYFFTPLWYMIVAENHLDLSMVDPLIHLFQSEDQIWDLASEQGTYLVGKLGEEFPQEAPPRFLDALEIAVVKNENKDNKPFINAIFLIESFHNIDMEIHGKRIIKLLKNPKNPTSCLLASLVADLNYRPAILVLKDLIDFIKIDYPYYQENFHLKRKMIEYKEALEILQGKIKVEFSSPYHISRANWRKFYKRFENSFQKEAYK